jgi:cobalt-zinc-cadmium resistance protein CzcA
MSGFRRRGKDCLRGSRQPWAPISTGLGEIFMWTVEAKAGARQADGGSYTPTELRTIQDWIVKPQLRDVPGVTEINTIGGYTKQIHVTPDPAKLVAYGLGFKGYSGRLVSQQR